MRKLLFILFSLLAFRSIAQQPYNNEWIDYSKTYYKFKIGTSGLYRINQASLSTIGLQNTPVEQFQLWRNGKQIPLFTTIATGIMGSNDYIEFWGKKNDGKPDKYLYRDTSYQLSDRLSLQTDTVAFFLTVNPNPTASSPNLRFAAAINNMPSNPPAPLPYFTYTQHYDFDYGIYTNINPGFFESIGESLYSSSYDIGEFLGSGSIQQQSPITLPISPLYAASNGIAATLQAAVVGDLDQTSRNVQINFSNDNQNVLIDTLANLSPRITSATIPVSTLAGSPSSLSISMTNSTNSAFDYAVCNYITLTYSRQFNFGGQTSFFFNLPSSNDSNYLQITNFNSGSVAPVLYDFTDQLWYAANTSIAGTLQFYLPPSAANREFLLVSEDATVNGVTTISNFQQRNFVNYATTSNQGNYLIISNKVLGLTSGGAVYNYQQYRISTGFNAKIYDIDDLEDQFAFGIKKHPLSVKNFIRYAQSVFAKKPSYVLLVGRGVTYNYYRQSQNSTYDDKLNLVPTWGWPASDALLVSPSFDAIPTIGFGRVSAVSQAEVTTYLTKVKEYEGQLLNDAQTVEARGWMKNIIHVAGGDDPGITGTLVSALNSWKSIISLPLFGGQVSTFAKTTSSAVSGTDPQLINLVNNGVSLLTYYGHGASEVLDYAVLNEPTNFTNAGKYPVFMLDGCTVGAFFDFDTTRLTSIGSYSEKFIFAQELGAIDVIATSNFGVTSALDPYSTGFYQSLASNGYNTGVSTNMMAGTAALTNGGTITDYISRTQAEGTVLAGDPAMKIYASPLTDFVVEQNDISISPSVLSVADSSFKLNVYLYNIGKFTTDSFVNVTITRTYPNGTTAVLFNQKIPNFAYIDSLTLNVPIVSTRDKGTNQITVTINNNQLIPEVTYANNTATISFTIFDNGITPIYPYNYAIVNKQNIQLVASTSNPLSTLNNYIMQLDTTALFNSPFKVTKTVSSTGGVVSFNPGITFTDSTVYYWRVAEVPTTGPYVYNNSSFVYLANSSTGFNQSHLYQHLQSSMNRIYLDSTSRQWKYVLDSNTIDMRLAVYSGANNEDADFATFINGSYTNNPYSACVGSSLIFNLYDPKTLLPFYNNSNGPTTNINNTTGGFLNSAPFCGSPGRQGNFEYSMLTDTSREYAYNFINWVKQQSAQYIVTVRLIYNYPMPYASAWAADSSVYGSNNTLYSALKSLGFYAIDSFNKPSTFNLIYQNNAPSFGFHWAYYGTSGVGDLIVNVNTSDTLGFVTSPLYGPAYAWKQLQWRGSSLEPKPADAVNIYVIGVDNLGNQTQLLSFNNTVQNQDISSINAAQYPYIQLMMRNADSINLIPYQLRYWRVLASLVPEGAMAPSIKYVFADTLNKTNATDTFQAGETITMSIPFKNISDTSFRDSITVQAQVLDNNNNVDVLSVGKLKKIVPGDTALVNLNINSANFLGNNTLYVNVNPTNNGQPEQYHFNNFIYQTFYVKPDNTNPVLDVTFDGTHILSGDIVSSKPNIQIRLVENSKYLLLNDTSVISVQLLYPDGTLHQLTYSSDTLHFTPATPNSAENAALTTCTPTLSEDGNYELIVTGKNRAGLTAGTQQYRVQFQVINTPMISNVFNYPNPFTTSTAFVFTLTGSQVPQNIKIEIMTVSGRIVKEITREQLGNLHIGNNITTYKWDGTDMFGAKLGNGVYLYRVVTRLNGSSIGEYPTGNSQNGGNNTDMYFKGGYGKMYLMR